ncbi:sensor histidine kinase [Gracilinema caldarium]|uniref:histidine kinase n=1 Tax=Gracilinema caldarium (strain ATCC 51460 / DSM 7334 / H1) TaxID=744872 RepID=F8EY87_GRAC1|nr:sensor histidine kinase [Gracilinema caldarium]AEJ18246.1 signal transduction histidine kinase [Gracilinema caldarium DSM 7334]
MPDFSDSEYDEIREKIIGMGERSARKSYYPELQKRIKELEEKQQTLMELVRTLEEQGTLLENTILEKDLAIRELHHRIKNNFQIIQSIMGLGINSIRNPEYREDFLKTKGRIDILARIYIIQLEKEQFSEIALAELIQNVIDYIKYNRNNKSYNIKFDILLNKIEALKQEPMIDIDKALYFSLLINEVLMNCIDFGISDEHPEIRVRLAQFGFTISVSIEDDGPGIQPEDLQKETVGISLIRALSQQIHAVWQYTKGKNGGSYFSLSLKRDH